MLSVITFPFGPRTLSNACGAWWTPPEANVAYTSVISSGVNPTEPSVIAHTGLK